MQMFDMGMQNPIIRRFGSLRASGPATVDPREPENNGETGMWPVSVRSI